MKKFKVIFVTFTLLCLLSVGYGEKICNVGSEKITVSDDMDCKVLNEISGYNSDVPHSRVGRSARPFFFPGFPFPPGLSSIRSIFGNQNIQGWLRPRPPSRPRPRPPSSDIEECPDEGIKFISHPENCEKYILCVDGDEVATLTCPDDLHFSREQRTCTNRREAGCEDFEFVCPDVDTPGVIVFLPNKEDCSAYYLCFGGNEIPMNCAPGLHWSIDANMCLTPELAQCEFGTPFECPSTGIHQLPNPDSCEDFYLCVNGNGVERSCPGGLHFSPHLNSCAPPETAGCDSWSCPADSNEISFIPNTEDCTRYYICLGGNQIERECTAGLHWSIASNMCMNPSDANCQFATPFECPETGVHQLPHPDNCEDYYLCINGNELERSCPNGLHFSPHLGACAPKETAGCDSWSCPADSNEISFIPNTKDCNRYYICLGGNQIERECAAGLHWSISNNMCMSPSDADCQFGEPFECPETGVHQLPNPDNCKDYYLCVNGNEFERTCPQGLHFSPHLEICTSPELAGCDGFKCPADSDEISFIPNVKDCSSYFICMSGNEIKMNCAPGLHWSMAENRCMSPDDANCLFGEAFSCPETGVHQLPNPDSCDDYYLCINGNEMERTCPSGLHFSPHLGVCADPATAGCEGWECDPNNPGVSFIPNTEDCSSYFICMNGNKIEMNCAQGLHWSIANSTCMSPNNANCPFEFKVRESKQYNDADCPATGIVSIPNRSSCEEYFLCVNGMALPRQCSPGLHFSRTLGTCVHPDVAECTLSECPSSGLSFLPHEDDCTKYYLCFGGTQHLMRCPSDLHWSTETNSCMDPYEAQCEDFDEVIECPATGIEQIPYPDDCERFVLCVNGFEIPMQCGAGLHFSPSRRQCMLPEDAECEDSHHTWKCPEIDTPGVIVFIPNTEDCNRYYLCWGGQQIPLACAIGQHWSIHENRCMHPDEAECPWRDNENEIETCPEEGVKAIPDPESCEHYILCVNGFEVPRDCPVGMHFSREIRQCTHPLVANCVRSSLTVAISTTTGEDSCPNITNDSEMTFMRNSKDCQSYYLCTKDESVLFNCAEGLAWNADKKKCMIEAKANCSI